MISTGSENRNSHLLMAAAVKRFALNDLIITNEYINLMKYEELIDYCVRMIEGFNLSWSAESDWSYQRWTSLMVGGTLFSFCL